MSSSGVTNYSVTEREVIEAAAADIGVLEDGQTLSASETQIFRRKLNMLVKQWVAQADFAPGLKMWTRKRAFLFLQQDQVQYEIGPSGDECASETYASTTLAASLSGTAATVTSSAGMSNGDRIGFVNSLGSVTWTTIGSVVGTLVTLNASVTADSGARVFAYTSKPVKPFEILSGSLRDTDSNDSPIDVNLSLDEYELIPGKMNDGTPARLYFEAKKASARVYLDSAPDDVTKVLRLVFYSYIEDTTASTQDVDFPAEWFRPLAAQLAIDSALAFSRPVTPELKMLRDESLQMARNAHPSKSDAYFKSDPDDYS